MNLGEPLYLYCERLGPGLLAEPLNAVSNLAFFYAAWRLWGESRRGPAQAAVPLRWLAGTIALVGAGSLAFHTFATAWGRILDLAFIGVFNLLYLAFFLKVVARWPSVRVALAVLAFLAVDRGAALAGMGTLLNGSGTYLPAIATLLALAGYALKAAPRAGQMMAGAAGVFLVSLTARTVDQAACGGWPWGTHFLWHLLNAWVLYRLSRALQTASGSAGGISR